MTMKDFLTFQTFVTPLSGTLESDFEFSIAYFDMHDARINLA